MPKINRSLLVKYSPAQMYQLVNDIESYPLFLPWCSTATIESQRVQSMQARLSFAQGMITQSFTTLNTLEPDCAIHMKLVSGPFKSLAGSWHFEACKEGCLVSCEFDFEFESYLMALAAGPFFQQSMSSMLDAFMARATTLYD